MDIGIIWEDKIVPRSGRQIWKSLKEGVQKYDNLIYTDYLHHNCHANLLWSVQFINTQRKKIYWYFRDLNIPVIIGEVGALERNKLWRVSLNNIDMRGTFPSETEIDVNRPEKLGLKLEDWRKNRGKNIIICLQNEFGAHWPYSCNTQTWLENTIREIRNYSNRPIIIRQHPRKHSQFKNNFQNKNVTSIIPDKNITLLDCLDDAWCVINVSSNPAIDAVMNGIPIFTGETNLAYPVSSGSFSNIENPKMPERRPWLNWLSNCEWTEDEIREGIPYCQLRPFILPIS